MGSSGKAVSYTHLDVYKRQDKLYASILRIQLNAITETMHSETQNGFRKGKSCLDCIFTIAQLTEKHCEYQIPT